jgi:hypothetical protein
MLLLLAMGLVVIHVTTACNKTENSTSTAASTNSVDTNATAPPAAH